MGTILPIAFSFGTGVPLGGVALPLNFRDGLIYQGAFPLNLPVTIRAKLNGQPVFEDLVSVPIQEAGVEYLVTRSIPLDETRGYVKRIMRTWTTYRLLSSKTPPPFSLDPVR